MPSAKIKTKDEPLIGAHMSIAGGAYNALLHAEKADCRTVQLFNKSSNQWAAKPLSTEEIDRFHAEAERTQIKPCVSHTAYLINCGSPDRALYKKSVTALAVEYDRCCKLGLDYLVMHPGAHIGSGLENGINRIGAALNKVLEKYATGGTTICLEAVAGAGSTIGRTFEELQAILAQIEDQSRVGVCLDTCHIFAAGYDIRTRGAYQSTMAVFDRVIGLERLKVWHLNDCKGELGSHRDRHEHLGRGHLGERAFHFLMRDARFRGVPKILETPKEEDGRAMDPVNLALLRKLARRAAKK
ncbi:deoxyribonuclease IV [Candidatus Zixiibacteriota bacterium]